MATNSQTQSTPSAHHPNSHSTSLHTYSDGAALLEHSNIADTRDMRHEAEHYGRPTSTSSSVSTDLEMDHFAASRRSSGSRDVEAGVNGHASTDQKTLEDGDPLEDDEIITADGTIMTREEQAYRTFWHKSLINGTLILLWYFFSVSISVYNKWMFADKLLNFHFPLFTTSFHMIVQFSLASLVIFLIPKYRPRAEVESHRAENPSEPRKSVMTKRFYFTRIAPCASATGLDIGLGNTSLRFVTLTFFTMCKSSTLGFVLLFAVIFRLEKMSWKLAGIIAVMTFGVIMMVAGEVFFSAIGFVLLMLASFFSGLRWSLTQILLKRNPATSNPFASLFYLTPVMFLVIFVIAVPIEGFGRLLAGISDLADRKGGMFSFVILVTPGVLAFLMTASEFALLQRTSVVTLSVCGIFKEVLTIGAGGIIYHDILTPTNVIGVIITITAIGMYNYMCVTKMRAKSKQEAMAIAEEHAPMLSAEPGPAQVTDGAGHQRIASTGDVISRNLKLSTDSQSRDGVAALKHSPRTPRSPISKTPQNLD